MPHRILVVDDEAHILQVLSLKLRNAGYEVITAVDGEEAFEYATREGQVPDVIISDYQMPYMTGLELCRALASNALTAHVPVLLLTARGHALDPEDVALRNIRDVLSKPFSPRAVVEQIQRLLAGMAGEISPQARSEVA
jgi:two-component system alkaline phosphatase synthesis response regulator PhoP